MNEGDLVQVTSAMLVEQLERVGSIGKVITVIHKVGLSDKSIVIVLFSDSKQIMFYPNQLVQVFTL